MQQTQCLVLLVEHQASFVRLCGDPPSLLPFAPLPEMTLPGSIADGLCTHAGQMRFIGVGQYTAMDGQATDFYLYRNTLAQTLPQLVPLTAFPDALQRILAETALVADTPQNLELRQSETGWALATQVLDFEL